MKIETIIEIISATHLTHYIESPFTERGGLMFVAPPASFKSAITSTLDNYPNSIVLSDLTIKQAAVLRDDINASRIVTLAFSDLEKLYQRHGSTASNIEGFLKALVAEGFRRANWEDQRMTVIPARCCVIGSMTNNFYIRKFSQWIEDGFARRFLWSHFRLSNPDAIVQAILRWERLDLSRDGFSAKIPTGRGAITYNVTSSESEQLLHWLRWQQGKEIGLIIAKKIVSALKWKFPKEKDKAMAIFKDFAESLTKEGAVLELPEFNSDNNTAAVMVKPKIKNKKRALSATAK